MNNCRYCKRETKEREFCSLACKQKWIEKEENVFIQQGAIRPAQQLCDNEKQLQQKFLKKIGKRKAKKKLEISQGVL